MEHPTAAAVCAIRDNYRPSVFHGGCCINRKSYLRINRSPDRYAQLALDLRVGPTWKVRGQTYIAWT